MQRRQFLISAGSAAALSACGGGGGATDGVTTVPTVAVRNAYVQTNLVATKASYGAQFLFPDMINGWGIATRPAGAGGHFWVQGGGSSYQFVGDVQRSSDPALRTLFQDGLKLVPVQGADAKTTADSVGKSTGTVFNGAQINSALFRINGQTATRSDGSVVKFDGSARFVFVTDSGVVSAWTDRASDGSTVRIDGAAQEVFNGAAQKMQFFGCAMKTDTWDTLWVADFGAQPQIRQFDAQWNLVPTRGMVNPFATGTGGLARPGDPVPFNIWVVDSRVFIAYCISQPLKNSADQIVDVGQFFAGEEDSLGADTEGLRPGRGKLVEYTLTGDLVRVYEDDARLNAPWGVAIAPADFGALSNALLVGSFGGAGRIAAFDQSSGRFIDFMRDTRGNILGVEGLWGLVFGNGASLGDSNALYFAAGPQDETAGLFGSLRYAG